ncbi:FAD dependent oxidoreductase protein [Rutstroemia sp. NJR-2017a BBW]|nr:FAD dependent oxidoreductase protein [Rutstroemia sp. NJR-2017a BBW]
MAPDLNSLPPSRSLSGSPAMTRTLSASGEAPAAAAALRGQSPSPSPRSASTSLQAAAAGFSKKILDVRLLVSIDLKAYPLIVIIGPSSSSASRNRQSSHTGRRRSTVLMNLQMNDPNLPPPGEIVSEQAHRTASPHSLTGSPITTGGDPHHFRAPSLGEIHQEIEQEQEAQVNRLLQMIRAQQQQLQQLQAASGQSQGTALAIDESTPTSERSLSFSTPNIPPNVISAVSTPRSPSTALHPRTSFDIARADLQRRSRTPSRTASPRLRSTSISNEGGDSWSLGGRDETAYYQAETQNLVRENQMLRQRIRELERQVNEFHTNSSITREPVTASHLTSSTSASEDATPLVASAPEVPAEDPKPE